MDSNSVGVTSALIVAVLVSIVTWCFIHARNRLAGNSPSEPATRSSNGCKSSGTHSDDDKRLNLKPLEKSTSVTHAQAFCHSWQLSNLKGHSGEVFDFDFSPNGKFLISCADDRSVLLWTVGEFLSKEHKTIRGNISFDSAKFIQFASDSKSFIVGLSNSNKVAAYKMAKKDEGSGFKILHVDAVQFPDNLDADIIAIGISCNGKFIMTANSKTDLVVWDLRGNVLKSLDTHQGNNYFAAVSPCGRFVASAGFTTDVKLWEVQFTKTGDFQDVVRAFELKGHSSGIYSFAFNATSTRMATASKDGTVRIWNTQIEFRLGQEAYLLQSVELPDLKTKRGLISLSPNGDVAAVGISRSVHVYNIVTNAKEEIANMFASVVAKVAFSICGKYLVAAGDKQMRVFHNIFGYKAIIAQTEESVSAAHSQAHKDRLKAQLIEAENALAAIEARCGKS